ncbi:hypothetical protein MFIFM68171_05439 [Madurella fahalii]|uniref:Uncharacterized protein n=1 Tax=Madurella fahalii TaxID=1157608 RepID=A0ABQ0GBX6_9PEZI
MGVTKRCIQAMSKIPELKLASMKIVDDAAHSMVDGQIFCHQVPDTDPAGHPTQFWKFTSRDGEVSYGIDSLTWFEEWDTEAGDCEEPTPFCQALREFYSRPRTNHACRGWNMKSAAKYLGEGSKSWEVLKCQEPPKGTFEYVPDDDPIEDRYWWD